MTVETEGKLGSLEKIHNFRDIGGHTTQDGKRVRQGLLFRCARPDEATEADVGRLVGEYSIDTIVDLRAAREVREHVPTDCPIYHKYTLLPTPTVKPTSITQPPNGGQLRRYNYPVLGLGYALGLFWQQPSKFKVLKAFATGNQTQGEAYVIDEVLNAKGLYCMYETMIRTSSNQVAQALMLLTAASNRATLYHCSYGKDRTGLMTALVLACLNVPDDVIAEDFNLSEAGLEPVREHIRQEIVVGKGHTEEFALAHRDVILKTLALIRKEFGSVTDYLARYGFGAEWVECLRTKMLE